MLFGELGHGEAGCAPLGDEGLLLGDGEVIGQVTLLRGGGERGSPLGLLPQPQPRLAGLLATAHPDAAPVREGLPREVRHREALLAELAEAVLTVRDPGRTLAHHPWFPILERKAHKAQDHEAAV